MSGVGVERADSHRSVGLGESDKVFGVPGEDHTATSGYRYRNDVRICEMSGSQGGRGEDVSHSPSEDSVGVLYLYAALACETGINSLIETATTVKLG